MTTLEATNAALRSAVETRNEAQAAGLPRDEWYGVTKPMPNCASDEGCASPALGATAQPQRFYGHGPSAAEVIGQSSSKPPAGSLYWADAYKRLGRLHQEKTAQYGGDQDPFENVTASAKCGVEPWRRALCDLSDCVVRMQKYARGQPVDYQNALLDAANWALICLVKIEEEHREER